MIRVNRTDGELIKDIEEWNKQRKAIFTNVDKQSIRYLGIYDLLDELIRRIKD